MNLLKTLGLPPPPPPAGTAPAPRQQIRGRLPKNQTTITIFNETGADLRLTQQSLKFATARFEPAAPAVVAAHEKLVFRVVETTVGAARTDGSLRYHCEQQRHRSDAIFTWGPAQNATIRIEGDRVFSPHIQGVSDSETGNTYFFGLVAHPEDEAGHLKIGIHNRSGFDLVFVAKAAEDPAKTEFSDAPDTRIAKTAFSTFFVQPLDGPAGEAAASVTYRIDRPAKPQLVKMRWRRGGTPVGTLAPDDGAFMVTGEKESDGFTFVIDPHSGPPPGPPAPTKITIVNDTAFVLKRDLFTLDGRKAVAKSEPPETIDGGRKAKFEIESTDPEFPETGGFVAYAFKTQPADGELEHIASMGWSDASPPFARIAAPAEGVDIAVSGSRTDIVYTLTGPPLDFEPPAKAKQPTLRRGDKSPDGWVEYLQEALNHHINAGLEVDGDFGGQTLKAVKAFQRAHKKEGVLEDGIVGDQTWSFLREGVPESPKTDGRKPHSFVEKGVEARWVREQQICRFDAGQDALVMQAISVGDADSVAGRSVRVRIVNPDGVAKVVASEVGAGVPSSKTGQGNVHDVKVRNFATLFDDAAARGKPPPGAYAVDAFFEAELGGDRFNEVVTIERPA